jgi:membrane-associated PAP2 superfamily phosphatase
MLFALASLVTCGLWFEFTATDLLLQPLFYNPTERLWVWNGTEPISRLLFYDGVKGVLIALWLCCAMLLLLHRRLPRLGPYVRGLRIVFLSLILVPATVAGLKAGTNVACPRDLSQFGGELVYAKMFQEYPASSSRIGRQHCFPAAHASAGFALLSLFFLFKSRRNRRRAIYASLAIGWTMGSYKIVIGDHFLSHTIVSMLLAWLIINGICIVESRWHARQCAAPVTSKLASGLEF